MTPTEQHQLLRALWPKWRLIATSANQKPRTVRSKNAVGKLYELLGYPPPRIQWQDGINRIAADPSNSPAIISHHREAMIYAVWPHLARPAWVCSQIGYNESEGNFRLPRNLRIITLRTMVNRITDRRPVWLRDCSNMISQFDADALALIDLAEELDIKIDPKVRTLATTIMLLLESVFAAVLFEDTCLLIKKPKKVVLNEALQLSCQGQPAFVVPDTIESRSKLWIRDKLVEKPIQREDIKYYVMNGRFIGNTKPKVTFHELHWASPEMRLALIEFIGWEKLLDLAIDANKNDPRLRSAHLISHDRYGLLYMIRCGAHTFTVVKVKNKTAEPDGSYRTYVIPVDSMCRPLPDPNNPRSVFGRPQAPTALNAVASTFGMTGSEYAAILGAES